jgi:transposase
MNSSLFEKGEALPVSPADAAAQFEADEIPCGTPRLRVPQRDQVEIHWASLDQMLEAEDQVRVVWAAVCRLNLSLWLRDIKAVEGHVGRDATDPRLLLALWVYATLDSVGSAREVARLCEKHLAYRWLCGGVTVNYHMLADFRSRNEGAWNELLTQIVGSLMAEGLVTLQRVAQDGMRVRADAGKSSFRGKKTLEECLREAREQVEMLKKLADESPEELNRRQAAARKRAAAEWVERIEDAIRNCEQLQQERETSAKKSGRKAKDARASTTDPEARVMQFSDGGYRPGYNVQFSTDTQSGVIVGVDVVNVGNDSEQLVPMIDQLETRYDQTPEEALVDGGFASLDAIDECERRDCDVYAPLKDEKKQREAGKDPYVPKKGDNEGVAAWRARMGTAAAKAIYQLRCQTAEWVNAISRNHGLWHMPVRGKTKCRTTAMLYAITHDLLQGVKLRAQAAAESG